MNVVFKNIISGIKHNLNDMEKSPIVTDMMNTVDYIIKTVFSHFNIDKSNKTDTNYDEYDEYKVLNIIDNFTSVNITYIPYGNTINSRKASIITLTRIEINFNDDTCFHWLGYNSEMEPNKLLSDTEINELPGWYYNSPYNSKCKKMVITLDEHSVCPNITMYNDKESRKYVFNQNFLFTEVIRIAGRSEYKGALAKDMQYSKIIY